MLRPGPCGPGFKYKISMNIEIKNDGDYVVQAGDGDCIVPEEVSFSTKLYVMGAILEHKECAFYIADLPPRMLSLREAVSITRAYIDNGFMKLSRENVMAILLRCRIRYANTKN